MTRKKAYAEMVMFEGPCKRDPFLFRRILFEILC